MNSFESSSPSIYVLRVPKREVVAEESLPETYERASAIFQYPEGDLLPRQFCWSVIGVPNSGKTTFLKRLVSEPEFYRDKFDYIISVSPSPLEIALIPSECQSKTFQLDWLYERINYLRSLKLRAKNLLFIFDDCVSQLKKVSNDPMLVDLFFNRRHIIPGCTISIILTTQ